jgi:WXXGXW repeat (2 copies)
MNLSRPLRPILTGAAISIAALALTACVVAPVPGYYDGPAVAVAPPPPQAEVIGVAPVVGYIWIGGFWSWVGNRHIWVRGHWEAPRPGYRWEPHHWQQTPHGWQQRPGHWERR